MRRSVVVLISLMTVIACKKQSFTSEYGPVLVEIDNKKLYASEIQKIIHSDTSPEDSTAIANAFIDRWIKNNLLISDAEKYLSSDFEVEEKVERYKNDLIKYKYEAQIIDDEMETEVTQQDLEKCYAKYKSNYILDAAIYKIMYAAIPATSAKIDRFYNAWLNDELEFIQTYSSANADTLILGHDEWISNEKMSAVVPSNLIKGQKLRKDRTIQKNVNGKEHFFKLVDMRAAQDTIPLELISSKIRSLLLHERKINTIENHKNDIYDKAIRSNRIKLNI